MTIPARSRLAITVSGRVQGVGFRPFIWRLATGMGITGNIRNSSLGVEIEIQGAPAILQEFMERLNNELPPLAKITALKSRPLPIRDEKGFSILPSQKQSSQNILVSPDIAICEDCIKDLHDPSNKRFHYPFTNCTNCGPRFSITSELPYDRCSTSMACFQLCEFCSDEYHDPANRRFHAQPVACPDCGPYLWYVDKTSENTGPAKQNDAIAQAGSLLLKDGILALKGLGGFQLACNARSVKAVSRLRQLKSRPHKALAVMCRNLEDASEFCTIPEGAAHILQSTASPITLLPKAVNAIRPIEDLIAPDSTEIGVMLPYTPLHVTLLDWLEDHGLSHPVLVMTSANPAGDPICLGNREALEKLHPLADGWLLHNRDILARVDDSVVTLNDGLPQVIRRARGYVPLPIPTRDDIGGILGAGAELKATFCLTRGNMAFMGQHIGDLQSPRNLAFYREALAHLENLLETSPNLCVCDLHPDFLSSRFAEDLAQKKNLPLVRLQHHAAHAASTLAENAYYEDAIAICLDGSGLGLDDTIWGGEFIHMNLDSAQWQRIASFAPFPLIGGERAINEPWRLACALAKSPPPHLPHKDYAMLMEMAKKNINCPITSSCGRMFDAVSSLLGLCDKISYEGQAAIRLETCAMEWRKKYPQAIPIKLNVPPLLKTDFPLVDSQAIFNAMMTIHDVIPGEMAYAFHAQIASNCAQIAWFLASRLNISHVALCGGVFNNRILLRLLIQELKNLNLTPLLPRELPFGDGAIAYGQAVWGQRMRSLKKLALPICIHARSLNNIVK